MAQPAPAPEVGPEAQGEPRWPHFVAAVGAIRGLVLHGPYGKPKMTDRRAVPRELSIDDLPLVPCGEEANNIVAFCDIIMDVPGPLNASTLFDLCQNGEWQGLPMGLAPSRPLNMPYTMQVIVVVDDPSSVSAESPDTYAGKYHIVKHFTLHGGKLAASRVKDHCVGKPMRFEYGNYCRLGGAAVQHMLSQLHGLQVTSYDVGARCEKKPLVSADQSARDAGYKHIREHGPRTNNRNQFMEWADRESHREGSPVFGWHEAKIREALHNHAKGRANAKVIAYWPFTLKDFAGWFLNDVLSHMLGSLRQNSICWIGRTRTGKSAGSKIVAMTQSDYEIAQAENTDEEPGMVTAKHLDFFKGEPVTKFLPGIFDDGLMQKQDAAMLKGFLNPGEEDATLWARYSSSTFDLGSSRQTCSNPYDAAAEEKAVNGIVEDTITHDHFKQLIAPSFESVTDPDDFDAILARAHMIVVTKKHVFWRIASAIAAPVKFRAWPAQSSMGLLSEQTRSAWMAYKKNPHSGLRTDDYRAGMIWSREYMRKVVKGEVAPQVATVSGATFSSAPASTLQLVPRLMTEAEMKAKIKVEKEKAWARRMSKASGTCLDITGDTDIDTSESEAAQQTASGGPLRAPRPATPNVPSGGAPGSASSSSGDLSLPPPAMPSGLTSASTSYFGMKREREEVLESFYQAAKRAAGQLWVVSDDEDTAGEEEVGEGHAAEAADGGEVSGEEELDEEDVFGFGCAE